MGEVKSVKVDNWGVFFLQKLQNFFNKTDYCDLTLQFRDNSQLKVHRLVLSACTDYFNVLEQTCEIVDDALIMPNEFQADVVVPIVNFMYTGTLEFELKMYGKLLRTAKEMNMTVLLKLLEAHRRTMENVNRQQRPPSPKGIRRRVVGQANSGTPQQRVMGTSPQGRGITSVGTATPLRPNTQRGITGNTMIRSANTIVKQETTSPFEQLRKGYNNNKRPAQTSLLSPPSKKPSLEEVKEFAEQQRMRKQIAAEFGDHDPEYDSGMLYDDVHAGDDDDDDMPPQPSTSKQQQQLAASPQGTQTQLEHGSTTIILKQDSPSQTPTIIVKDSSNAKLNHTKIIAEVLRQYPHIVKGHKNIKLKIMPNTPATPAEKSPAQIKRGSPVQASSSSASTSPHKKLHVSFKADKTTPQITAQQKAAASSQQKPNTNAQSAQSGSQAAAATNSAGNAASQQKRRIDSKTMHALIAQGAENTTGPWLCLRCGVNGRPISIPSYRGFRRHLINTHKETIDPALCEHCGWRSTNNRELHFHMYTEHQVKSLLYTFAECALCTQSYLTKAELEAHINEAHTDDNKQQCIYCNKVFEQELHLYRHMKSYHKEQALEDGIIDETDEEFLGSQDEEDEAEEQEPEQTGKVRILSNISLPPATSAIAAQHAAAADEQQMHEELDQQVQQQEVKFVGADGNEVELTDEQRKEILSQLNQQQAGAAAGGVVMVLSEPEAAESAKQEETDAKSLAGTEEEEYDDSQIYSELAAADSVESSKKSIADESKESIDNLEWAENLIAESEEQSSKEPKSEKSRDDISEKLKELTGDWTEDENDEEADDRPATTELEGEFGDKPSEPTTSGGGQIQEEEEDDIDLALKSLHKGPEDQSATKAVEEASEADDEAIDSAASIDSQPEKMEIDAQVTKATAVESSDVVRIKKESEVDAEEEEFIKEDPNTVEPEPETEAEAEIVEAESREAAAAATEGDDDVHMEAENIRKELLDELIAESEKPQEEEEDEEKRKAQSEQIAATVSVSAPTAAGATEREDSATDQQPAESEAQKQDKKAAKSEEESSKATEKNESVEDKPNKCDDVVACTDNKVALVSTTVAETKGAAASPTEGASGADKVKSLISEWGDDEEEEEDENGVSAAAKEEL